VPAERFGLIVMWWFLILVWLWAGFGHYCLLRERGRFRSLSDGAKSALLPIVLLFWPGVTLVKLFWREPKG